MMDERSRMIEAQAARISKLNEEARKHRREIENIECTLERYRKAGQHWFDLQAQIQENPTLASEWERFLGFLKMAGDDAYLRRVGAY